MKSIDAKTAKKRLEKWAALETRAVQLSTVIGQLESISGNFSEIRLVEPLVLNCGSNGQLFLEHSELTDYEIRNALTPVLRNKLQQVRQAMEDL